MREPFWGPNAKPMLIQTLVGAAAGFLIWWLAYPWWPDLTKRMAYEITKDSLACEYFTCQGRKLLGPDRDAGRD